MSLQQNEQWLENARENFEQALERNDYEFAQAVIGDVKENGFYLEAVELQKKLATRDFPSYLLPRKQEADYSSVIIGILIVGVILAALLLFSLSV